jgi:hypothetical protein
MEPASLEALVRLRELLPDQDFTQSTLDALIQELDDWGYACEMHAHRVGWTAQIYRHWHDGNDEYFYSETARDALLWALISVIENPEEDEEASSSTTPTLATPPSP